MRKVNLSEIAEGYTKGEILPTIQGKLLKLGKRITGQGQYGEWSLQSGELGGDGTKVAIVFSGLPEMEKNWVNRDIIATAVNGDKGLAGIMVDDYYDKKKNITIRQVKIDNRAELGLLAGGQAPAPRQEERQQERAPDRETASNHSHDDSSQRAPQERRDDRVVPGTPLAINESKKIVAQSGNLLLLAAIYMENVFAPAFKRETGKDLDEVRKGAWTTSISISAQQKGAAALLPTTPMFPAPAQ